ncbi:hypothetical protein LCGC14_3110700 [marine sediment metagenome]|uniref:Uncharacterized protein n=1 Tax=marine sediment metagenome TaxID=412755 RepID=A0A0F8WU28_9ZZZZ
MKAIISELWDTGLDIITTENDSGEISCMADLRKCENVLVGEKHEYFTEAMIDDSLVNIDFRTVSHPTGCGRMSICFIN